MLGEPWYEALSLYSSITLILVIYDLKNYIYIAKKKKL